MAIRMTGLNSGLNTESIIAALMSAQRTKQTKIENKQTKLEWKKEVWDSLNTKLVNFYKTSLSKMKLQSNYKTKAATSSNTSKVTAKATTSAATGSYAIKVQQIASAQSVTGGKINGARTKDSDGNYIKIKDSDGKDTDVYEVKAANANTKLIDLMNEDGKDSSFKAGTQIRITTGDEDKDNLKTVYFDVTDNTTIQDFVNKLTGAGLNASFDEKQQRFFISSNKSGAGNKFTISSTTLSSEGDNSQQAVLENLKKLIGYDSLSGSDKNTANNIMAGLQNKTKTVDDVLDQLTAFANTNTEKEAKQKATDFYTAVAKKKAFEDLGKDIRTKFGLADDDVLTDQNYAQYFNIDTTQDSGKLEEAVKKAKNDYLDKQAKKLVKEEEYQNKITTAIESGITQDMVNAEALGEFGTEEVKGEDGNTTTKNKDFIFDDRMTRILDTNKKIEEATNQYAKVMPDITYDKNGNELKSLGLGYVDGTEDIEANEANGEKDMAVVAAKDTQITYNGAIIKSDTTNISVAGLELNILSKTADDETVNISVTNDVSGIYDTIKDFVSEYNAILKEMNTYYNAGSSKGYDVLTDEEKDAMSESDVEKWENKIKDSLLRRDTTLNSIISSFRNNMMSGMYTAANGKRYSLSSIGISTSNDYAEGGLLHIRGDEDDSEYADKDNVLRKLLEEDPDSVMGVFTKLASNLYNDLYKKMSFSKISSAMTFYNDKEMNSQLSDYKKDISKMQSKLNEVEDRYYKQFTAMEKAMANMQSQQNSLASLLGGS